MCQSFAQTAPLGHTAEGVFSWRSFLSSGQNVDDLPLRLWRTLIMIARTCNACSIWSLRSSADQSALRWASRLECPASHRSRSSSFIRPNP